MINVWGGDWEIVGVIKDFNYQSLREDVEPMFIIIQPQYAHTGFVRLRSGSLPETLGEVESAYKQFNPNFPFDYTFHDQRYEQLYRSEMRMKELAKYFGIFAVVISCLGLFRLSSFTAEQRTKEIGVRKVLGATVSNLVMLLTREFTRLVGLAILIAVPVAWWLMDHWLSDYAYHIEISWWIFAGSGLLALIIAWLTVSWQSVRAAMMNPVTSLQSE